MCKLPAATEATPLAIWIGVLWFVVLPLPSWPQPLKPIAHNVPSVLMNIVKLLPVATEATPVATCTGVLRSVVVPSPN